MNWKIKVPKDFIIDSLPDPVGDLKTAETFQKNSPVKLVPQPAIKFIKVKTDKNNFLTSTVQLYDTSKNANWEESLNYQYLVSLRSLKSVHPTSLIDTSTSIEKIDGLKFKRFHTHIHYQNGIDMDMYLYARLYKGYDFSIILVYTDKTIGDKLFRIIYNSQFD
ncbi:MAG: hypothetical protein ACOYLO_04120 [Ferruginibacter sp.]